MLCSYFRLEAFELLTPHSLGAYNRLNNLAGKLINCIVSKHSVIERSVWRTYTREEHEVEKHILPIRRVVLLSLHFTSQAGRDDSLRYQSHKVLSLEL